MSVLQKIILGEPPGGSGGDNNRVAHIKTNENFDVVERSTPLDIGFLNDSADLRPEDVGKRYGLWMADAGKVIGMPLAASVRPNSCIHLFNVQQKVSIKLQAGDMSQLTSLNTGDWVKYVSDGVKIWHAAERGKMMPDEVISGNLTVGGDIRAGQSSDEGHLYLGKMPGYFYGNSGSVGWWSPDAGGSYQYLINDHTFRVNDEVVTVCAKGHALRFDWSNVTNGWQLGATVDKTHIGYLWHSGNLAQPMTLDAPQTVGSKKTFTQSQEIAVAPAGLHTAANLHLNGQHSLSYLGFSGLNNSVGVQLRVSNNTAVAELQCVNYNASTFGVLTASNFNQASDRAFKSDIQTLENVMARLRGKRGVTYLQKNSPEAGRQAGVIANEWRDFPELLGEGPEIDEDGDFIVRQYDESGKEIFGESGPPKGRPSLTFRYTNAVGVLLAGLLETDAALQDALARIAKLEAGN
ncbi:tail fiber domain-containing protein [Burkholderia thailandensis]|uniref:Chaperone of endosialidase family protein n=1 Tax=Burkholderia thailandensis TaxID=57975 RepID=A0AAW9D0H2_BURTH|nr:tail fiber domain-containing protein [Burkholderia thailandensis]MCS3393200.1 tail fiber domain-containing protein [Burkholderia thailandensis]MCS6426226.1 tail fiber domain-containing protein [Burkholderia thailandensis]MCS6455507.1 tail fiber domain-containing protein [Burkholderia thailandensis]MCS6465450.1 tail fiber domain-containing protein [Burkholderia thailandensis]MCS6484083.1 tail fiber domain-containing protein [Burkholderia thailandensis]